MKESEVEEIYERRLVSGGDLQRRLVSGGDVRKTCREWCRLVNGRGVDNKGKGVTCEAACVKVRE